MALSLLWSKHQHSAPESEFNEHLKSLGLLVFSCINEETLKLIAVSSHLTKFTTTSHRMTYEWVFWGGGLGRVGEGIYNLFPELSKREGMAKGRQKKKCTSSFLFLPYSLFLLFITESGRCTAICLITSQDHRNYLRKLKCLIKDQRCFLARDWKTSCEGLEIK